MYEFWLIKRGWEHPLFLLLKCLILIQIDHLPGINAEC